MPPPNRGVGFRPRISPIAPDAKNASIALPARTSNADPAGEPISQGIMASRPKRTTGQPGLRADRWWGRYSLAHHAPDPTGGKGGVGKTPAGTSEAKPSIFAGPVEYPNHPPPNPGAPLSPRSRTAPAPLQTRNLAADPPTRPTRVNATRPPNSRSANQPPRPTLPIPASPTRPANPSAARLFTRTPVGPTTQPRPLPRFHAHNHSPASGPPVRFPASAPQPATPSRPPADRLSCPTARQLPTPPTDKPGKKLRAEG
jgi:hypothetical protein